MLFEIVNIVINTMLGNVYWIGANIAFAVPWNQNYFWGLTLISLIVWGLECVIPWRKSQGAFRHEFWLDAFYMYFNFFIFSIVINGIYDALAYVFYTYDVTMQSLTVIYLEDLHPLIQLIVFFVLLDFFQWITHRALHRFDFLWRFHQVHHSIKEMGFAGHLRYHWMENVIYKPLKTIGVMLLGGFEPEQAFIVHFFTIIIGHINHANLKITYGPLKYLLNNPVMHLYHHAYKLPENRRYGMNFGLTLSVWDYLFKTAYVPEDRGEIMLGYRGDDNMSPRFSKQLTHGFRKSYTLKSLS
jgi:sterol desaturase/sphingolipid hydroxylase (fatty acid hydroxylase superfamily)